MSTFHLIANSRSGKGSGASLADEAKRLATELGLELVIHDTSDQTQFERTIDRAVAAADKNGDTVIAAGGDGTIRSVAQTVAGTKAALGVVACGTFNFFARNHRIPDDPTEALRLAMTGEIRPVRLGRVNGQYFLINASLGLYAKSIQEREQATKRFGRDRLVVIVSTIRSLLIGHRSLDIELVTKNERARLKTLSIFIGNNALQLRGLAMDVARCMKADLLAAVVLKPVSRWGMLRILVRGIAKTLEKDERLESFCVDSMLIKSRKQHVTVALDGELFHMKTPLEVDAMPEVLRMRLPPHGAT